jgi:hypothetical protein
MVSEIELDQTTITGLYMSKRFTQTAAQEWPELLLKAARSGSDVTLAAELVSRGSFIPKEPSRTKTGRPITKDVNSDAAILLAEGQFNMYYMRAVCLLALEQGRETVEVYHGKRVTAGRPESQERIGDELPAEEFLKDLRSTKGINSAYGMTKPNSGLTVWLPDVIVLG